MTAPPFPLRRPIFEQFLACFGTFSGTSMKGPCDRKWLPLTPSIPGGRTPNQNRRKEHFQKMTKLKSAGLFLHPSGFQLSGCKSPAMAEDTHTYTRTDVYTC